MRRAGQTEAAGALSGFIIAGFMVAPSASSRRFSTRGSRREFELRLCGAVSKAETQSSMVSRGFIAGFALAALVLGVAGAEEAELAPEEAELAFGAEGARAHHHTPLHFPARTHHLLSSSGRRRTDALLRAAPLAVVQLNEQNFEHLTQAATGATSGDWLVKFCKDSVPRCARVEATWSRLALQLTASREAKGLPRINVAMVDTNESPWLAKRFGITSVPVVLLFKGGVMYSFQGGGFSIERWAG